MTENRFGTELCLRTRHWAPRDSFHVEAYRVHQNQVWEGVEGRADRALASAHDPFVAIEEVGDHAGGSPRDRGLKEA